MHWKAIRDNSGCWNVQDEDGEAVARDVSQANAHSIARDHNAMLEAPPVLMISEVIHWFEARQLWPMLTGRLRQFLTACGTANEEPNPYDSPAGGKPE